MLNSFKYYFSAYVFKMISYLKYCLFVFLLYTTVVKLFCICSSKSVWGGGGGGSEFSCGKLRYAFLNKNIKSDF